MPMRWTLATDDYSAAIAPSLQQPIPLSSQHAADACPASHTQLRNLSSQPGIPVVYVDQQWDPQPLKHNTGSIASTSNRIPKAGTSARPTAPRSSSRSPRSRAMAATALPPRQSTSCSPAISSPPSTGFARMSSGTFMPARASSSTSSSLAATTASFCWAATPTSASSFKL